MLAQEARTKAFPTLAVSSGATEVFPKVLQPLNIIWSGSGCTRRLGLCGVRFARHAFGNQRRTKSTYNTTCATNMGGMDV